MHLEVSCSVLQLLPPDVLSDMGHGGRQELHLQWGGPPPRMAHGQSPCVSHVAEGQLTASRHRNTFRRGPWLPSSQKDPTSAHRHRSPGEAASALGETLCPGQRGALGVCTRLTLVHTATGQQHAGGRREPGGTATRSSFLSPFVLWLNEHTIYSCFKNCIP